MTQPERLTGTSDGRNCPSDAPTIAPPHVMTHAVAHAHTHPQEYPCEGQTIGRHLNITLVVVPAPAHHRLLRCMPADQLIGLHHITMRAVAPAPAPARRSARDHIGHSCHTATEMRTGCEMKENGGLHTHSPQGPQGGTLDLDGNAQCVTRTVAAGYTMCETGSMFG